MNPQQQQQPSEIQLKSLNSETAGEAELLQLYESIQKSRNQINTVPLQKIINAYLAQTWNSFRQLQDEYISLVKHFHAERFNSLLTLI